MYLIAMGGTMRKLICCIGLAYGAVEAETSIFVNGLAPIGGRFSLGLAQAIHPKVEATLTGRYFEQEVGLLTGLFHPTNVERMFEASGAAGLTCHPFASFRPLYGTAEVEVGYHSVRLAGESDSGFAEGHFLSPAVKAGYRLELGRRFSISPELGASYKWTTANFSKLRENAIDFPFEATRRGLERANRGLHPLAALNLAVRF